MGDISNSNATNVAIYDESGNIVGVDGDKLKVTDPDALTDAQLRESPVPVTLFGVTAAEITERMLNKVPADGYNLWYDTSDLNHLYAMEAPSSSISSDATFRGVRVTFVLGQPVGKVEVNTGGTLTFDNRTSDGGWA